MDVPSSHMRLHRPARRWFPGRRRIRSAPMLKIRFDNVWCFADDLPAHLTDALDLAMSYPVQGAEWSLLHESGIWDGRKHMFRRKDGRFPTGLLGHAVDVLRKIGVEFAIEDHRGPAPADLGVDVPEFFVRPPAGKPWRIYQQRAIDAALSVGRGVIVAPPRCLAGDQRIGVNRAGKSFTISLRDLVHRFNGGEVRKGRGYGGSVRWDVNIPTAVRVRAEDGFV